MKWKICIEKPFLNCEKIHPLQQKRVKKLVEHISKKTIVQRIVVFGSSVTKRCHIDSDVDLYVEITQEGKLITDVFYFAYDLWTNYTVDPRMKKEIDREGVVVFER